MNLRTLRRYQVADAASGGMLGFMVVFSPWAFGTTQPWSIWTMNICGYTLGALLLTKQFIRVRHGYRPPHWDDRDQPSSVTPQPAPALSAANTPPGNPSSEIGYRRSEIQSRDPGSRSDLSAQPSIHSHPLTTALAVLTAVILAYCFISALNARATYNPVLGSLEYHDYVPWLPHSYDRAATWQVGWNYLALACSFWALRDWLLGRSVAEVRAHRRSTDDGSRPAQHALLSQRLRWLLWLLSLNGALLAVECICQRLSGTNKLLWFMPTRLNPQAIAQFGPYAYRANGAQYLNLVWPASLACWWALRREARRRRKTDARMTAGRHHLLLPCVLITAAGPIISTSRGGAIVTIAMLVVATLILIVAFRRHHPLTRFGLVLLVLAVLATGAYFGGERLMDRMGDFNVNLTDREASYNMARSMIRDHAVFGVGPGAFAAMFQFYRSSYDDYWPAQLHNDWLETRITFGWLGSALIALAFLAVLLHSFCSGGISGRRPFMLLLWLALAGCLVHARWDFPFQICSIAFLFLVLCAILSALSLRTSVPSTCAVVGL